MGNILIYDLTSSDEYGKDFGRAIEEIGKYRQISVQPQPGILHPQMRQRAMDLVQRYYSPQRDQVNAGRLLRHFSQRLQDRLDSGQDTYADIVKYHRVFLLDQDIHTDGTNWVFGFFQQAGPLRYLISSKARITSSDHAFDHLVHELGHMYGAPSHDRINTTQHLGLHCTVPFCVMQQRDTVAGAVKYVNQRLQANAPVFCNDCRFDLITAGIQEGFPISKENLNRLRP